MTHPYKPGDVVRIDATGRTGLYKRNGIASAALAPVDGLLGVVVTVYDSKAFTHWDEPAVSHCLVRFFDVSKGEMTIHVRFLEVLDGEV